MPGRRGVLSTSVQAQGLGVPTEALQTQATPCISSVGRGVIGLRYLEMQPLCRA